MMNDKSPFFESDGLRSDAPHFQEVVQSFDESIINFFASYVDIPIFIVLNSFRTVTLDEEEHHSYLLAIA